jgi:cystine transport system substrate-binding protein
MRKDGTLTKLSKKFFQGEDVTKKHYNSYKKIDISDVD